MQLRRTTNNEPSRRSSDAVKISSTTSLVLRVNSQCKPAVLPEQALILRETSPVEDLQLIFGAILWEFQGRNSISAKKGRLEIRFHSPGRLAIPYSRTSNCITFLLLDQFSLVNYRHFEFHSNVCMSHIQTKQSSHSCLNIALQNKCQSVYQLN